MDFLQLAKSRQSIRNFRKDDIPDDFITSLLEAAQAAPSGGNRQPWRFYVIKNRTLIEEIREKSCKQAFIADAPLIIVVCADILRSAERYMQRGRELYCIQDTAAAIQNILLCAHSLGLGACWCGAFDEKELSAILSLEGEMRPLAIIPIGYPQGETEKRGRRPVEDITTFIL